MTGVQTCALPIFDPPARPVGYDPEKHRLGAWGIACQFAIFELMYNLGEPALPYIRDIAWDEYDWTQGNAIELLIRFAADGVQTEAILEEISEHFPSLQYEAQAYAIEPLLPRLKDEAPLKAIFDQLMEIEEFEEVYRVRTTPYVDPDPYNLKLEALHGDVAAAKRERYTVLNVKVIAVLIVENLSYSDFRTSGGRVRVCISDTCELGRRTGEETVEPVRLRKLLRAKRIAIKGYHFKQTDTDPDSIFPRCVTMLA